MTGFTQPRRFKRPTKVTQARWAAWLVIRRTFDDGAWTDRAFTSIVEQLSLEGRERAFAQRLAYGTVQQAKRLDYVIGVLGKRPLAKLDPPVLHALRLGLYELLEQEGDRARDDGSLVAGGSSAHAAVSQAVELVRGVVGERAVAFTNAILRRAQVDARNLLAKLDPGSDDDLAVLLSMPEWLVTRVRTGHGELGIAALAAQNDSHANGTAFRINAAHRDVSRLTTLLEDHGIDSVSGALSDGTPVPGSLLINGSTANASPLVESGLLVPQSLASQLVSERLGITGANVRVLDMCAAPGGKTTHIASLLGPGGDVLAVELHEHRAASITKLAERTGTADRITVRVGDATELTPEEVGTFDFVLLDAPCTGTGVLAGRPDARWKRSDADVAQLVTLQERLLATAQGLVRPGGVLVYSTCSILVEEDEAVAARVDVEQFTPDGAMRTWPQLHGTEGFFIARFVRLGEC
ncbi:MAG: methyltransferase domain-containing protein [Thermoleophilia bacterium]|nr:methyltransferase domain-containing protein [Thermoleophilia bacterium]